MSRLRRAPGDGMTMSDCEGCHRARHVEVGCSGLSQASEGRSMKFSRRDMLVWGRGSRGGSVLVTPIPWKLLDDTSKWSQKTDRGFPQPARGPVDVKQSVRMYAVPEWVWSARANGWRMAGQRGRGFRTIQLPAARYALWRSWSAPVELASGPAANGQAPRRYDVNSGTMHAQRLAEGFWRRSPNRD